MSLDLFFLPRKATLAEARADGFVVNPAMQRVRRQLVADLLAAYPGTRLEGDALRGHVADFPRGELSLHPGYLHWSLHGVTDTAPIHAVVTWFHDHGLVCDDPQDAGFANRDLKRGEQRVTLDSFEDLVGARLVGVRLLREWGAGIAIDWELADGSPALVQFVRFEAFRLPDLGALRASTVTGVHFEPGDMQTVGFDVLRVFFAGDVELYLDGGVFQKSVVKRKAAPPA